MSSLSECVDGASSARRRAFDNAETLEPQLQNHSESNPIKSRFSKTLLTPQKKIKYLIKAMEMLSACHDHTSGDSIITNAHHPDTD